MARRTRKAKKQRGGNGMTAEEVLTMLGEAVMLLTKPVTVVMESEDGDTEEKRVSTSEYVLFSMGNTLIDKGYDKAEVLAALEKLDNLAPSDEFPSYSLKA